MFTNQIFPKLNHNNYHFIPEKTLKIILQFSKKLLKFNKILLFHRNLPPFQNPNFLKSPLRPPETSPHNLLTSPHNPLTCPPNPLTCSRNPFTSPRNLLTFPHNALTCPHNPLTCPHNLLTCPHNPLTCPQAPLTSPHNLLTSPHNPFPFPHNPLTCPQQPCKQTLPKLQPQTEPNHLIFGYNI